MSRPKWMSPITVNCSHCGKIKEREIKEEQFLNIEEDIQGRDVLTFICPHCGTRQKSLRFG